MKNNIVTKVDTVLTNAFFAEDAAITMRGLSVAIDEFMNGNTWIDLQASNNEAMQHFGKRLSDILYLTTRTLEMCADRTSAGYIELEHRILDAVSDDMAEQKNTAE